MMQDIATGEPAGPGEPRGMDLIAILRGHLARRPLRPHLIVWMLTGIVLGLLIAPDERVATWLGHVIAGCLVTGVLAVAAYPFSESHRHTLAGTLTGLAMIPVVRILGLEPLPTFPAISLIIGALIGGTCFVWLAPIRLLLATRMP